MPARAEDDKPDGQPVAYPKARYWRAPTSRLSFWRSLVLVDHSESSTPDRGAVSAMNPCRSHPSETGRVARLLRDPTWVAELEPRRSSWRRTPLSLCRGGAFSTQNTESQEAPDDGHTLVGNQTRDPQLHVGDVPRGFGNSEVVTGGNRRGGATC